MERHNILVIGSANADLVIYTDKMPKLGQTVMGKDFAVNAGGKGLNQAVAIAKLGGKVSFLGAVGNDGNGQMLRNALRESKVEFVGITDDAKPTGTAVITVVGGDNSIVLNAGANDSLRPEVITEHSRLLREAEFIVVQLEIPTDTIAEICRIAKEGKAKLLLNPAPYKVLPEALYSKVDYLIPNEHEAESITGICPDNEDNCIRAIRALQKMGAKNVIITLGARGCVYNDGEEVVFVPPAPARVVDTTSAGDSFIGGLTASLAEGRSLTDAIGFATRVAAVTISRKGAARSIPFAYELK